MTPNTNTLMVLAIASTLLVGCSGNKKDGLIGSLDNGALLAVPLDTKIVNAEKKALEHYQRFIKLEQQSKHRAEAQRRLADLQLELAERAQTRAMDELDKTQQDNPMDTNDQLPEIDYKNLASSYEEVLRENPDFAGNDEILYQLSKIYLASNEPERATAALDQLVQRYPNSKFYYEAQFRRGENLFLDADYVNANIAYQAVISAPEKTPFYEHALYKSGWSLFKQSNFDQALDAYFKLLDLKLEGYENEQLVSIDSLPSNNKESIADAFRSASLCFYYQAGAKTAGQYFDRTGKRHYEHLAYAKLAEFYLQSNHYEGAIDTYSAFIKRNEAHPSAPTFQNKIITIWNEQGNAKAVLAAKRQYIEDYGLNSPYWYGRDPNQSDTVIKNLKLNIIELASYHHAQARKNKKIQSFKQAASDYHLYLSSFPKDEKTPHIHFLWAETLYETHQYAKAAQEYEQVAYHYDKHKDAAEAGYAALLAYAEHEKSLNIQQKPQWQKTAINSALRFSSSFPDHPESLRVLTKAADDLFKNKDTVRAKRVANIIVQRKDAPGELKLTAHTILAHAAFDEADYPVAETHYKTAIQLTPKKSANKQPLIEGYAAAMYKQGEALLAKGDNNGAANQYLRVAHLAPKASIVATALYDAAATFIAIENWGRAIGVLESFRQTHPQHPLQNDVRKNIALAYLNHQQYDKAAYEFEQMSLYETDPETQRQALWQAVDLYQKIGHAKRHRNGLINYIDRYPMPFETAMNARQRLADIANKRKRTSRYHHWLQSIVAAHAQNANLNTERTHYLAASASLVLADTTLQGFKKVKLVEPLKKNLKTKKELMQVALQAYEKSASYGITEVSTAATYRIAELYNEFSSSLMASARPRNLSAEELEQYELMLEEQAIPFEDKAIELHEINAQHASKEGIYTPWVAKSFKQLGVLFPARYDRRETREEIFTSLH